jgi:hypothetical protein
MSTPKIDQKELEEMPEGVGSIANLRGNRVDIDVPGYEFHGPDFIPGENIVYEKPIKEPFVFHEIDTDRDYVPPEESQIILEKFLEKKQVKVKELEEERERITRAKNYLEKLKADKIDLDNPPEKIVAKVQKAKSLSRLRILTDKEIEIKAIAIIKLK